MSSANPLAGLIGHYDSDSEEEPAPTPQLAASHSPAPPAVTHPAPHPHCAWSACYDDTSGYTYYWNQYTNAVTWEAPPEYLLALKLASQQLHSPAQHEVTAEEWTLYQQALAEKQNARGKTATKPCAPLTDKEKGDKLVEDAKAALKKNINRRRSSDSEDDKIELITSYYNSDSDSNEEPESPIKQQPKAELVAVAKPATRVIKKVKKVRANPIVEYGPPLPPNQEYTVPIGPELPPNFEPPKEENIVVEIRDEKTEDNSQPAEVAISTGTVVADKDKIIQEETNSGTDHSVKEDNIAVGDKSAAGDNSVMEDNFPAKDDFPVRDDSAAEGDSAAKDSSPAACNSVNDDHAVNEEVENMDSQDESTLMQELLDKAKILENLGGELPTELKDLIKPDSTKSSRGTSPVASNHPDETSRESKINTLDTNIDDLLEEIEKKEMPKRLNPKIDKIDMFSDDANFPTNESTMSAQNSPIPADKSPETVTKETEQPLFVPLFPSSKENLPDASTNMESSIIPQTTVISLFPSVANISENYLPEPTPIAQVTSDSESKQVDLNKIENEKKGANIYIMSSEGMEPMPKKRKRISSNVLPEPKKSAVPSYTTKYAQYIDGFSTERTGLGFKRVEEEMDEPNKKTFSYGNYGKQSVVFTKGETLNEDKTEEVEKEKTVELTEVLELKLKFLNQQSVLISPVQELTIQMQTLISAYKVGALTLPYWKGWVTAAWDSLARLEASAAPPGWICEFIREEGRYRYRRECDGRTQWEYPAYPLSGDPPGHDDMDISTTPPPPPLDPPPPAVNAVPSAMPAKKARKQPPPPPPPAVQPPPPPPPAVQPPPPPPPLDAPQQAPPPPPSWRLEPPPPPPPPPTWSGDSSPPPPPPGCDEEVAFQSINQEPQTTPPRKESIGDELMSFYNDIAELEKQTEVAPEPIPVVDAPSTSHNTAEVKVQVPPVKEVRERRIELKHDKEANGTPKPIKKKAKVKISAGIGMKQKTVSSLVAKWQQVQEEINSD